MQLTIRNGEKRVKVLKPEVRKLTGALEVLEGLADCGDRNAREIHGRMKMLLNQITDGNYGAFFGGQKSLLEEAEEKCAVGTTNAA